MFSWPMPGRFLLQAEMGPVLVVVGHEVLHQAEQVGLITDDDMVQELAAESAHEPFHHPVLPGSTVGDELWLDAKAANERFGGPEDGIPVKDQVPRSRGLGEGLSELLTDPGRSGMGRHMDMGHLPAPMADDHEAIELAEGRRGDREEVHGSDVFAVGREEGFPGLGPPRRSRGLGHIAGYRSLGDPETQHAQFAMDPWGSPQGVLLRQAADQRDEFSPYGPPPMSGAGLPSPEGPEPGPMPSHDGGGRDHGAGRSPAGPDPEKDHPEGPVPGAEPGSSPLPPKHCELLSQGQVFKGQIPPVHPDGEEQAEQGGEPSKDPGHPPMVSDE